MAELKTYSSNGSVQNYLAKIDNQQRRNDCIQLDKLFKKVTDREPKLWGGSMVGYGEYHYKYDSGHEGNFFLVGFANRKQSISLYLNCDPDKELLHRLGSFKMGKACIYIKKLNDIDPEILSAMVTSSIKQTAEKFEIVE